MFVMAGYRIVQYCNKTTDKKTLAEKKSLAENTPSMEYSQ